ncbi:MAG: hypothetical protein ACXAC6_09715 [Candidatus Hodarchaeales archaeon]|jgi:hypothetical protein
MILQDKTTITNQLTNEDIKNDSQSCQYCDKLAICNIYTCYKQKQGNLNCSNCEERLCQHHWRMYFRRMMK